MVKTLHLSMIYIIKYTQIHTNICSKSKLLLNNRWYFLCQEWMTSFRHPQWMTKANQWNAIICLRCPRQNVWHDEKDNIWLIHCVSAAKLRNTLIRSLDLRHLCYSMPVDNEQIPKGQKVLISDWFHQWKSLSVSVRLL